MSAAQASRVPMSAHGSGVGVRKGSSRPLSRASIRGRSASSDEQARAPTHRAEESVEAGSSGGRARKSLAEVRESLISGDVDVRVEKEHDLLGGRGAEVVREHRHNREGSWSPRLRPLFAESEQAREPSSSRAVEMASVSVAAPPGSPLARSIFRWFKNQVFLRFKAAPCRPLLSFASPSRRSVIVSAMILHRAK